MKFLKEAKGTLLKLEKAGIVSRKPSPIFPFTLFLISLALFFTIIKLDLQNTILLNVSMFTTAISSAFAVTHWLIVKILKG